MSENQMLKFLNTSTFPFESTPQDFNLCFCATHLLNSSQQNIVRNILCNPNSNAVFMVRIYAVLEDGVFKKYLPIPIEVKEIANWVFSFLENIQETTGKKLEAFSICLTEENDTVIYKRLFVTRK